MRDCRAIQSTILDSTLFCAGIDWPSQWWRIVFGDFDHMTWKQCLIVLSGVSLTVTGVFISSLYAPEATKLLS